MNAAGWRPTPEEREALIASWPDGGASEHIVLEARYSRRRGNRAGDPPALPPGAPVPGCACERCTRIPVAPPKPRRNRRDLRPALDLDRARARPLLDVAAMLQLGEPRKVGREYVVRCPLHEDRRPSLRINPARGVWYCDPCGEGGDGIRLLMRARGLFFVDAVRELAA